MVLFSAEKVRGCSGKVFKVSNNNRAGTAILPVEVDSTVMLADMLVSRSEAVMVSRS